jgi:hypothetical protein
MAAVYGQTATGMTLRHTESLEMRIPNIIVQSALQLIPFIRAKAEISTSHTAVT